MDNINITNKKTNMTINLKYNQLNKILNNQSEIHFIIDSDNFFDENNINMLNTLQTGLKLLNY